MVVGTPNVMIDRLDYVYARIFHCVVQNIYVVCNNNNWIYFFDIGRVF